MKKVLITGAKGIVGGCVTDGLRESGEYEVVAADIRADIERSITPLDVRDLEQVMKMTEGIDTIVHLAWYKPSDQFEDAIIPVNFIGTYNIYEAARLNGVKRVIFGSSNHTTGFYRVDEAVTPDSPYRPDSLYGLGKCYGELIGRMYSDKYNISSINMRIGYCSICNRPTSLRRAKIWISYRDMVCLTKCCIDADEKIKYLILYGTSHNTEKWWDISYLEKLIGYKPRDNSWEYVEYALGTNVCSGEDDNGYQGGEYI